jgi:hypothetical protein
MVRVKENHARRPQCTLYNGRDKKNKLIDAETELQTMRTS